MGWAAETQTASEIDAVSYSTNAINTRSASRSSASINSDYGAGFLTSGKTAESFGGYSVVGIKVENIPAMKAKIEEEVERIQTYLNGIGVNTEGAEGTNISLGAAQGAGGDEGNPVDATIAIKSPAMVKAINGYIESVKKYAKALLSNLLAFADKLEEVSRVWKQSTENFATNEINSSSTSMAENSTFYQQKYESGTSQVTGQQNDADARTFAEPLVGGGGSRTAATTAVR